MLPQFPELVKKKKKRTAEVRGQKALQEVGSQVGSEFSLCCCISFSFTLQGHPPPTTTPLSHAALLRTPPTPARLPTCIPAVDLPPFVRVIGV